MSGGGGRLRTHPFGSHVRVGTTPWTYPPLDMPTLSRHTHPYKGRGTRDTHPLPVGRQTPVETLPSRNFVCGR